MIPPHKSGPASDASSASATGVTQAQRARMRLAYPPWCPTIVGTARAGTGPPTLWLTEDHDGYRRCGHPVKEAERGGFEPPRGLHPY